MSAVPSDPAAARAQIAAEVLRVHETSYGTTAEHVTVHILDGLVLVLLDDLEPGRDQRQRRL